MASLAVCVIGVASYVRWRAVRLFLAYSIVLPVLGLLGFVYGVPLTTDKAEAAEVRVRTPVPIVLVIFDEFPVSALMRRTARSTPSGTRASASLHTPRPGTRMHHRSTSTRRTPCLRPHGPHASSWPAAHPQRSSRQRLHASRDRVRVSGARDGDTPLSNAVLWQTARTSVAQDGPTLLGRRHRLPPRFVARRRRPGLPSIDQSWGDFLQQGQIQAAETQTQVLDLRAWPRFPRAWEYERFLASLHGQRSMATLYAIHLFQPHAPWSFLPSGHQYGFGETIDGTRDRELVWERNSWLVTQGLQRHLLQVGYADSLVGRLTDELRRHGLYDSALIVVTADHGVSFVPGGNRRRVDAQNVETSQPYRSS